MSPRNIVVNYVAAGDSDNDTGTEAEGLSITESTTSRFEAAERKIEARSLEEEVKSKLKQKVLDILTEKYNLKKGNMEGAELVVPVSTVSKQCEEPPEPQKNEGKNLKTEAEGNLLVGAKTVENVSEPQLSDSMNGEKKESAESHEAGPNTGDSCGPSYSGSFEAESSEPSPSLSGNTEGRTAAKDQASNDQIEQLEITSTGMEPSETQKGGEGEDEEIGQEVDEEQDKEERASSDDETELQTRLGQLSTIDEVSSVESSRDESVTILKPDDSQPGPHLATEQDQATGDQSSPDAADTLREVGSGDSEPRTANESHQEGVEGSVDVANNVVACDMVEELSVVVDHRDVGTGVTVAEVEVNVDAGQPGQIEIILRQSARSESFNSMGPRQNDLPDEELCLHTTSELFKESDVIESKYTVHGGSGDSVANTRPSLSPVTPIQLEDGENIALTMDISQGELSQEVSIHIEEEHELEKVEEDEEEDLATNAPSILLDSEGPGLPSGRPTPSDELQDQLRQASWSSSEAPSPQPLSAGEVLLLLGAKSEGEVGGAGSLSFTADGVRAFRVAERSCETSTDWSLSSAESSVEVKKSKRKSDTNLVRSSQLGCSATSSSLSEGEWRASPRQMQRFFTMASAFGLIRDQ